MRFSLNGEQLTFLHVWGRGESYWNGLKEKMADAAAAAL